MTPELSRTVVAMVALAGWGVTSNVVEAGPQQNLALTKPYTLVPEPDYAHCTDEGDGTDLTDGRRTDPARQMWIQKLTSTLFVSVPWAASEPMERSKRVSGTLRW